MSQGQLARCPYCQQGTLVTGYFCAFCGRMLRQPPQAPPPQAYQPAPQQYPQPAPTGGRPPLICSHCQTANEPWLNNCKSCQRPLSTTR